MPKRVWSDQQEAIFEWFEGEDGNLVVRARAGSGKTTTILEAAERAAVDSVLLCAFNKRIADELNSRIEANWVQAKTLHSLGFAAVRSHLDDLSVDNKGRGQYLTEAVCGEHIPYLVGRMVTKLHTLAREAMPHATECAADLERVIDLACAYECEPETLTPAQRGDTRYTTKWVARHALEALVLAGTVGSGEAIDFADMLFLPVRHDWITPEYDLVVVDEAQDMNRTQLEMALHAVKTSGRIALVGDDRQGIYGFRGADTGSIDRMKGELGARELGLTVTYRCGQSIVREAQRYVPDIEAHPDNPEGEVRTTTGLSDLISDATAASGDFILSRKNAPLAYVAMGLLRARKRVRIAGKDIGEGLVTIVNRIGKKSESMDDFRTRLSEWEAAEVHRILGTKHPERVGGIHDKADCLRALCQGVDGVGSLIGGIGALFADSGDGKIVCSSIHKAKGLETTNVFILTDTLGEGTLEEENLRYVSYTRAKDVLTYVGGVS